MNSKFIKPCSVNNDFFFTWVFGFLKKRKNPRLCEIPNSLNLSKPFKELKKNWSAELKSKSPSFEKAIFKVFWPQLLLLSSICAISNLQKTYMAVMIKELIDALSDSSGKDTRISLLASGIVLSATILSVLKSNAEYQMLLLGARMRCLVTLMVNQKLMKVNSNYIDHGKILNVLGSDMELFEFFLFTPYIICTPLLIINASLVLTYVFDISGLIGIGISIAHVPFIFILAVVGTKYRAKCSELADKRIKLVNNLIEGIKIFKFYAWELKFLDKIKHFRKLEISERYKLANINALMVILSLGGLSLVVYITFYVNLKDLEKAMTLAQMYMVMVIFLTNHLSIVHMNTVAILTTLVLKGVFKRVTDLLLLSEFTKKENSTDEKYSISSKNAGFTTKVLKNYKALATDLYLKKEKTNQDSILNDVSFKLKKKMLLMVVGSVGSGKSALLLALQNELFLSEGELNVCGKLSYASELSWIISGTVKENILMGLPYNESKYKEVLSSCALEEDIQNFSYKDETWIGERGITLSGGQKARINLARAIYREFDILLLDDPLSSVDANVANHIFNNCILNFISKGKTVVLATHQLQFLKLADKILIMENGTSKFFGSPVELESQEGILNHIRFKENFEKNDKKVDGVQEYNGNGGSPDEELMNEKLKSRNVYRYIIGGFTNPFFIVILIILYSMIQIFTQEFIYWCSHREELDNQSDEYFLDGLAYWLAAAYFSVIVCLFYSSNLYVKCNHQLHNTSLNSIATSPVLFFDKNPSGRIINRFTKDIMNCDGPLQYYLVDTGIVAGFVLGSIIVQLVIIPLVLVSIPFYLAIQIFIIYKVSPIVTQLRKMENLAKSPLLSLTNTILEGIVTIRCQGIQKKFIKEMKENIKHYFRCYITYQGYMRFCQLYSDLSGLLIVIINLIIIVQKNNEIEIGLIAYSLSASVNIVSIASVASKDIIELCSYLLSAQRLIEYQDLITEDLDNGSQLVIEKGKIRFENLCFKYQPNLPIVLNKLSFKIKPGEKIGIVGRTGSGKSSILHVLCRLTEPESGTIFIDGQDYRNFGLHDLRKQISVIPQSVVLFSTTLRDNLDPFKSYSDEKIRNVLELVKLSNLFNEEKGGLDAWIGAEGMKLSAGEKQLICIARAILINNKIVLLDEATSNIDLKTDGIMQNIFKNEFRGSALIVIAHRILTAADSDKILVMENGECVEFESPIRLFDKSDSYFNKLASSSGLNRANFEFKNQYNTDLDQI